jgi:hypothetical protein
LVLLLFKNLASASIDRAEGSQEPEAEAAVCLSALLLVTAQGARCQSSCAGSTKHIYNSLPGQGRQVTPLLCGMGQQIDRQIYSFYWFLFHGEVTHDPSAKIKFPSCSLSPLLSFQDGRSSELDFPLKQQYPSIHIFYLEFAQGVSLSRCNKNNKEADPPWEWNEGLPCVSFFPQPRFVSFGGTVPLRWRRLGVES